MATSITTCNSWGVSNWQEAVRYASRLTDALGCGMDEEIIETVAGLNLLGYPTFQSCEGHLDHGRPYPWIICLDREIGAQFSNEWRFVCDLEKEAESSATLEAFERYLVAEVKFRAEVMPRFEQEQGLYGALCSLIRDYAAARGEELAPHHLIVRQFQPGKCDIVPAFSLSKKEMPEALRAAYLASAQAEMQAFTGYLKRRWQEGRFREA